MTSEDRRACPIFRIEHGTFQENHTRTLNYDYPSMNEDEDVCLRVTKLSSINSSPLSLNKILPTNNKTSLVNSSANHVTHHDSWDDTGQSLNDDNTARFQSLSDDYVFL
jgi:hypothetical protein